MIKPKRNKGLFIALLGLGVTSIFFFFQQNFYGQIGGKISPPKLLWLDYAIVAWFILPYFLWRSSDIDQSLRWIYGLHLINFATRGVIELYLLYVTVSWIPPYGIAHDFFSIGLISSACWWKRKQLQRYKDPVNKSALRFLISIRLGLVCEIIFAWLFYRITEGQTGIYFANNDPAFTFVNTITWIVVLFAYPDIARMIWAARKVLLPFVITPQGDVQHA